MTQNLKILLSLSQSLLDLSLLYEICRWPLRQLIVDSLLSLRVNLREFYLSIKLWVVLYFKNNFWFSWVYQIYKSLALRRSFTNLIEVYILSHHKLNLTINVDWANQVFRVDGVSVATKSITSRFFYFHHIYTLINQVLVNNWILHLLVNQIEI